MYFDSKNLNRFYPEKATVSNEGLVIAGVKEYQADDIVTSTQKDWITQRQIGSFEQIANLP